MANERDLENLEALDQACLHVDGAASVTWATYEELLRSPGVPMLCATPDGDERRIVAAGWAQASGQRARLWGKVHPNHRRKGVGTYLLRWTEEQARRLE